MHRLKVERSAAQDEPILCSARYARGRRAHRDRLCFSPRSLAHKLTGSVRKSQGTHMRTAAKCQRKSGVRSVKNIRLVAHPNQAVNELSRRSLSPVSGSPSPPAVLLLS